MNSKAYNQEWIFNREVQHRARGWAKAGFLSAEQLQAIVRAFPSPYYAPHLFIKIALFIFTFIGSAIGSGLVFLALSASLLYNSTNEELSFMVSALICGGGALLVLELLIKSSQLYRSGADNALLYIVLGNFLLVLALLYKLVFGLSLDPQVLLTQGLLWVLLLPALLLLLAAVARYADPLVGAVSFLLFLGIVATFLLPFSLGKALLPFGLMLACAGAYHVVRLLARRPDYLYYRTCLRTVKALTLASFYLAGNYLVVREANALLNDLPVSAQIRFAPLFYGFTVAIPLLYLYRGLRRADRIFLYTGLLTLAFSLYTYRFYRSLLPPEWALTLGGILLIGLCGWALRYLRPARHGLSSEPADSPELSQLNLESLVLSHMTENSLQVPEPGFQFGGGESGGGGAEGRF